MIHNFVGKMFFLIVVETIMARVLNIANMEKLNSILYHFSMLG